MKTDAVFAGAAEVKEESVDEFPDGGYASMFGVLLHIKITKKNYSHVKSICMMQKTPQRTSDLLCCQ